MFKYMKRFFWFTVVCFLGIVSCVSGPEPLPEAPAPVVRPEPVVQAPVVPEPVAPPPPEPESPPVEEIFILTNEVIASTRADIQQFVGNLNQIIRRRDYKGWADNLDTEYLSEISSPAFLERISNEPRLKSQKKVLKSAEDYFTNVIVPSRANDRVDDIEFITETKVRAYTVTPDKQRFVLYNLVRADNSWKISSSGF
jgi:hypothetical protein